MLRKTVAHRISVLLGVALGIVALGTSSQTAEAGERLAGKVAALMVPNDSCAPPPDLPRRLATRSKYDQSIASRSVIDEAARQERADTLAPIKAAVRTVASLAQSDREDGRGAAQCAIQALRHWAAMDALTEMATSDSSLTRDRLSGDIAAIVLALQARGESLDQEQGIRAWLRTLGRQTMGYYDWKAGPTARRNNHRYWAGIAVADIGDFLGDRQMQAWSEASFELGACQIDANGFLQLELERADRAYEYHLYAYDGLNRLAHQATRRGKTDLACADRLDRLHRLVAQGTQSAVIFANRTGMTQQAPSRLQLNAAATAPPTFRNPGTTSGVDPM